MNGWTLALAGILGLLVLAGAALFIAMQVNRLAVLAGVDRITGGSRGVELVERVALGDAPTQSLSLWRTEERPARPQPVLLFVHGGSWNSGDPDYYGFVARALAPEGLLVAKSGYRLGEEGRFPAMLEDTADAVSWLRENAARHGGDPDRIYLAGHSAGAYNVVQVALEKRWLAERGIPEGVIKGVIGIAGPYDFYPFDSDSTKAAFGFAPDPEATQPVNFVRGDAPPMLLATGTLDTTVKPRNTRALAKASAAVGSSVETRFYEGVDHIGILLKLASPWRGDDVLIRDIAEFIAAQERSSVPVQRKSG